MILTKAFSVAIPVHRQMAGKHSHVQNRLSLLNAIRTSYNYPFHVRCTANIDYGIYIALQYVNSIIKLHT